MYFYSFMLEAKKNCTKVDNNTIFKVTANSEFP